MTGSESFDIFLVAIPGLEPALCDEALASGFAGAEAAPGGVQFSGGWPDVWRANLVLRGATRVLVRIARFPAVHLAQLDKRARRVNWAGVLRPDVPVSVEAVCRKSRIYHSGAAAERVQKAIQAALDLPQTEDGARRLKVMVRIEKDMVTISLDTSGEGLHRRGFKQQVNAAPLRETMAALFLRQCGFRGDEPVLDPMCGSGTFIIEAAEWAAGLLPGRARRFALEQLATFDAAAFVALKAELEQVSAPGVRFFGFDRDDAAVKMSAENAQRAGVADWCSFAVSDVGDVEAPDGPPGLVMVNPPYGTRLGNTASLQPVYARLGQTLRERFSGWRVGLVTADAGLARATRLPLQRPGPVVAHGGLKVRLFQTRAL